MTTEINPEWIELLNLLQQQAVRFLIVGGHAVSAHGYPRFTEDLDIFLEISPVNAERVMIALKEFFDDDVGLEIENFLAHDKVIMIGRPPYRVDFLTSIEGVEFKDAFSKHVTFKFGGTDFPFIGFEHLIANKKAAGRPKDLGDVGELELRRKSAEDLN